MRGPIWRSRWQALLDGFLFVPALITLFCALLAFFLLAVDHAIINADAEHAIPALAISPSAVQSLLSTITASLITVTGLIYSITMVTLQLTSSQFTPRALRGVLGDRINQLVGGGLLGTYTFCLLTLINIRVPANSSDPGFVPRVSVYFAIILTFLSVALLLVFIQRTSQSIQVAHITARIAERTLHALTRRYSEHIHSDGDIDGAELVQQWFAGSEAARVYAPKAGNVQAIALEGLLHLAQSTQLQISLDVCAGDFVTPATVIAHIWPAQKGDQQCIRKVQRMLRIGQERDLEQDAAFGIRQLADICLRALSPAVNDPTTGVLCIGYLQAILERVASERRPTQVFQSAEATGVLVARYRPFQEYIDVLTEIGRYATNNARVVIALLEAIEKIAQATPVKTENSRLLFLGIAQASCCSRDRDGKERSRSECA